jgi:hypothetical protein
MLRYHEVALVESLGHEYRSELDWDPPRRPQRITGRHSTEI